MAKGDDMELMHKSLHGIADELGESAGIVLEADQLLEVIKAAVDKLKSPEAIAFKPAPTQEAVFYGAMEAFLYQFGYVKLSLDEVDNIDKALEDYAEEAIRKEFPEDNHQNGRGLLDIEEPKGWVLIAQTASKKVNGLRRYFLEGVDNEG